MASTVLSLPGFDANISASTDPSVLVTTELPVTPAPLTPELLDQGIMMITIVFPLTAAIGTIGNIFSLLVMQRPSLKFLSTGVYLSGLAVSDTMLLWTNIFLWWIWLAFPSIGNLFNTYSEACKTQNFCMQFFSSCSAWLVVGVSMDRFIAINYPNQSQQLCTPFRAKVVTIVVFLLSAGIWLPDFWIWDVIDKHCTIVSKHYDMMSKYLIYIRLVIQNLLPSFLLIVINIGIVVGLIKQHHHSKTINIQDQRRMGKHIRNTSILVLATATMFVVLSLTYHGQYAYMVINVADARAVYNVQNDVQFLLRVMGYALLMVNHSTNFFIYVLSHRKFRKEFWLMVTGCCKRNKKTLSVDTAASEM